MIDGVKYRAWGPSSEDEFEGIVKEHAGDVFSKDSLYFDIKQKIKSAGLNST